MKLLWSWFTLNKETPNEEEEDKAGRVTGFRYFFDITPGFYISRVHDFEYETKDFRSWGIPTPSLQNKVFVFPCESLSVSTLPMTLDSKDDFCLYCADDFGAIQTWTKQQVADNYPFNQTKLPVPNGSAFAFSKFTFVSLPPDSILHFTGPGKYQPFYSNKIVVHRILLSLRE
jgi:hypothetical protein